METRDVDQRQMVRDQASGVMVLQATTGHSTDAMTEHYSNVDLMEKKEATAKLLSLVGVGQESSSG